MKKKLLPVVLLLALFTAAKSQSVGALTVFSDDGDKFYLILNGQRQNQVAQTHVRVDGLNQPFYSAKVIFENTALPEIGKNLGIADGNNTLMDATYKIKHDKNGQPKLGAMPFSFIPYQANKAPEPDVYQVQYGASQTATQPAGQTVQTTSTTTTATPTNVNMDMNGMNVGVHVSDPNMNATTVQTTTTRTTTTTTSGGLENNAVNAPPAQQGCKGAYPMTGGDFGSALSTIQNQGFEETKLSTAKQIAGGNCLSTGQIAGICKSFGFEESKLAFAKFAYDHCTEPQNYFKINNVFGFSSSADDLNAYIQGKR